MEIIKYPDPVLRKPSAPILSVREDDRELFERMAAIMYSSHGIGLAAPQIGVSKKMIVVDIGDKNLICMANPVVINASGKESAEEGCLSVPDIYVNVARPAAIKVKAIDKNGALLTFEAKGLLARAILHEIDHINGRLIIDHLNFIKRFQVLRNSGYIKKHREGALAYV